MFPDLFVVTVNHLIHSDTIDHQPDFPFAEPVLFQVHALEWNPALLEISFRFLQVKVFAVIINLDIHAYTPTLRRSFPSSAITRLVDGSLIRETIRSV